MTVLAVAGVLGTALAAVGTLVEVSRDRPRRTPRSHPQDPASRPPGAW